MYNNHSHSHNTYDYSKNSLNSYTSISVFLCLKSRQVVAVVKVTRKADPKCNHTIRCSLCSFISLCLLMLLALQMLKRASALSSVNWPVGTGHTLGLYKNTHTHTHAYRQIEQMTQTESQWWKGRGRAWVWATNCAAMRSGLWLNNRAPSREWNKSCLIDWLISQDFCSRFKSSEQPWTLARPQLPALGLTTSRFYSNCCRM